MAVKCMACGWLGEFNELQYVAEPDYDSGEERSWDYVAHCPKCFSDSWLKDLEE